MSKVRVIAVTNQKGGVGKTTTAINLSACLAAEGKRVLAVDADQQGNTTSGLGLDKNDVPLTIYDVFLGEATIAEVKQPTCMDGLEVIPANINLTGAEIELIGNDRIPDVKPAGRGGIYFAGGVGRGEGRIRFYYHRLSAFFKYDYRQCTCGGKYGSGSYSV